MPLSISAQNLLRELVLVIEGGLITAGDPRTYPSYSQLHSTLGLQRVGDTYGISLKHQGLEELALWVLNNGYPAITGLIVNQDSNEPDESYFRAYGRDQFAFDWWEQQIEASLEFDWRQFLPAESTIHCSTLVISLSRTTLLLS